jgi:hypothetical protein
VLGQRDGGDGNVDRMLVPTDFSKASDADLAHARNLAEVIRLAANGDSIPYDRERVPVYKLDATVTI